MIFMAVLIYKAFALLTFSNTLFIISDYDIPVLYFNLKDENNNLIGIEKELIIQIDPMMYLLTYPTTKFISEALILIIPSAPGSISLKLSCSGCEIYTTIIIMNNYFLMNSITLAASDYSVLINQEISIYYNNIYNLPYSAIYLLDQEEFDLRIGPASESSGFAYASFSITGVKTLLFYFTDGTATYIGGITIEIIPGSFNDIVFTTDLILFIESPLGFIFSVYSDKKMTTYIDESCEISLSLSPFASISGTTNVTLTNGVAVFSNLYINTIGSYRIQINGSCISSFESKKLVTITGVDSIKISVVSNYIQVGKEIEITVNPLGPSKTELQLDVLVTLISSNLEIAGEISKITSQGQVVFYIIFDTIGETTLSAYTNHDLNTIDYNTKKVYILESMCLETQQDQCVSCVPLANLINSQCICGDFSIQVDVYCECIDGYANQGNKCITKCFNTFNSSDVKGYYNNDYKSISIEFQSNVVESSEGNCVSRISLPDYLNYLFIECKWENSKTMNLKFSSVLNGNEYIIELDSSLTPVVENCNYEINLLNTTIPSIELPIPLLSLDGPSVYNMLCGEKSINITNLLDSPGYTYYWTVTPSNGELKEYLNSVSTNKIVIPNFLIEEGVLNITCKVMILQYNTSATDTIKIITSKSEYLEVAFNTPNKIFIPRNKAIFIKGFINFICGQSGLATYNWEYLSLNSLDFKSILSNNPEPNGLLIPQNILEIYKEYSFKLTITIASSFISGSNIIVIKTIPSDLLIEINKTSGIISKTQDLIIKAKVVDPDFASAEIKYEWNCLEINEMCKSSTLENLTFIGENDTIVVQKDSLRNGAYYSFNVIARSIIKQNTASVRFYVDDLAQGELNIQSKNSDLNENIIFLGNIMGMIETNFSWNIEPAIISNIKKEYSFISIPKTDLKADTIYNFSLTATPTSGNSLTSYILITQPSPPKCSTPIAKFLSTNWLITVNSCTSDSYSLTYEFGCFIDNNSTLWLTSESYLNEDYILIPNICHIIFAKVCNGLSCTVVSGNKPDGNITNDNIISDFNMDILNGIKTPNAILYYSYLLTTQDQWSQLMDKMNTFYRSQTQYKSLANILISSLNSMILKSNLITSSSADTIYKFTKYTLLKYKSVLTSNHLKEIFTFLNKLGRILDFNSLSEIVKNTTELYLENSFPGSEPLIINSELLVYAARTTAEFFTSLNIQIYHNFLEIPKNMQLEVYNIYNIVYTIYPPTNGNIIFDINFYTSGTYLDYKLDTTSLKSVNLDSQAIYATIEGNFTVNKNYECKYLKSSKKWVTNGCKVVKISNGAIKIKLKHQSTFIIDEIPPNKTCGIGLGPILTSCVWLLITFFAGIVFNIIDKNQENDHQQISKYSICSFTSIFIHQDKGKRTWAIIYLCSENMVFICLIGVLMTIFTTPQEITTDDIENLSIDYIKPGILAWGITQIVAFPIYYCIFNKCLPVKIVKFAKYTALSLVIVCIVGIILMTIFYCKQYTYFWVIDYLMFLPLQMIIEVFFAIIVWKRQNIIANHQKNKVAPEVVGLNKPRGNEENINFIRILTKSHSSPLDLVPNSSFSVVSNIE
ncbi:hypothetical protein SteCoe_37705 [Stentor coeruleus]|uniref:Uncharacterized protein n=1 Tax=Stentor coeruleus TaxID=5963 RepID=A0A1R2AMU3_9CILI|nr:hypothetical protein SteCoe_37705 [Stentor coeruleus]